MEFLAANDQENIVHGFQAGAAGKQLNQGLKGFGSKTPGNKAPKTPFKVPLNDENAPIQAGKSVLKTNGKVNQNPMLGGKKGVALDNNAFVTPAGPRNRAPLGMKTTNAKTKAFQTPAPLSASAKTQKKTSPRLRRPKVKVLQAEPLNDEAQEEEREIEYMPPRGVPLSDEPEDWPSDMKYPMFEGKNFMRGMTRTYFNPVGDDGLCKYEREDLEDLERHRKKTDEELERAVMKNLEENDRSARFGLGLPLPNSAPSRKPAVSSAAPKPKAAAPSTLRSKSAAAALSPPSKPSYAAPTAAAKSRAPSSIVSSKKVKPSAAVNPSASRFAAATTASRSTIGYSQGRSASSSLRKPLSNLTKNAPPATTTTKKPTSSTGSAKSTTSSHQRKESHPAAQPSQTSGPSSRTFSRASSGATLTNPTFDPQDLTYEAEEELMHQMRFRDLEDEDDEQVDAWLGSFGGQQSLDVDEDEDEVFQLTVPEGL